MIRHVVTLPEHATEAEAAAILHYVRQGADDRRLRDIVVSHGVEISTVNRYGHPRASFISRARARAR